MEARHGVKEASTRETGVHEEYTRPRCVGGLLVSHAGSCVTCVGGLCGAGMPRCRGLCAGSFRFSVFCSDALCTLLLVHALQTPSAPSFAATGDIAAGLSHQVGQSQAVWVVGVRDGDQHGRLLNLQHLHTHASRVKHDQTRSLSLSAADERAQLGQPVQASCCE